jgi:nucleotide-binding universal stress UspA family protein
MQTIQRILWPTDTSESALRALGAAVLLAQQFGADIKALHVVEQLARPGRVGFAGDPLTAFDFPLYEEQMMEAARENLRETVEKSVPETISREIHVEIGFPKESILAFSQSHEIDLIVMATHGREGLSHLWLGSVAEAVVRQSQIPVLTVPIKETEQEK